MGEEFTLESPFVQYTFNRIPDHWKAILAGWLVLWTAVVVALIYLYAVVFASWAGFETALLVGVGVLIMSVSGGD